MFILPIFSKFFNPVQPSRYRKRIFMGLMAGFCLCFGVGLLHQPTQAQVNLAIIQEILDGDQVFIQDNQAKVDDQAEFGQIVLTKESRAGVLFNNGAAGRMDANSVVTVGQCVEIRQGQILVSGPINGCISGFTVGVQGTIYVLETTDGNTGNIKVLEGTVQVNSVDGNGEPVEVKEGEKVSVLKGILSEVIPMTPEEIVSILSGRLFSGFTIPVTPEGALYSLCSRLLPGFSCSTSGIPSLPIPTPPVSIPRLPF